MEQIFYQRACSCCRKADHGFTYSLNELVIKQGKTNKTAPYPIYGLCHLCCLFHDQLLVFGGAASRLSSTPLTDNGKEWEAKKRSNSPTCHRNLKPGKRHMALKAGDFEFLPFHQQVHHSKATQPFSDTCTAPQEHVSPTGRLNSTS